MASGEPLAADRVIVAMGPWTQGLSASLGLPPVMGLQGYSIVMQPTAALPAEALFVEYESASGERPSLSAFRKCSRTTPGFASA